MDGLGKRLQALSLTMAKATGQEVATAAAVRPGRTGRMNERARDTMHAEEIITCRPKAVITTAVHSYAAATSHAEAAGAGSAAT